MLLPVPEILLDSAASNLCTEIQLDERAKEISQNQSKLELKRREAAHIKEYIAAQHAQQATLDDLALRFEIDCLKAEDRLEDLQNIETSIKKDYTQWNMTEVERKEATERAVQEGKIQSQEIAELHRQLETSSLEAVSASQACALQKSNVKTANLQVENIRQALNAAQEEAAALRRRLDETELALAERTAALKMEARSATLADEELLKAIHEVERVKEGLNDEIAAGKELSLAAGDAERKRVEVEKRDKAAHSALADARENQKLAEVELHQRKNEAKHAEAAAQGALAQAGHSARSLAVNLQKHREMEEAIKIQENAGKSSKERHSSFLALVAAQKQQNTALDEKIAELSKQNLRLQNESECLKEKCLEREIALSNTQAQSKSLNSKAEKLHEQLQQHEGALYKVDFQLLMAKRAAALEKTAAETIGSGGSNHILNNDSPESLRSLKQELQNELENARITQRKQVRKVWEVEAAAQQVGAAAQGLEKEINKVAEQQKIEDVALKTAQSNVQDAIVGREDAQMAVDRASLSLARSQERFADKAKAVLKLSAAVEERETSFKTQENELENKLQELSTDHHAAINALKATRSALTARTVAVSTATATLSTLQLKTQTTINEEEKEKITSDTVPAGGGGGGVAGVCAEMQRQVEELQAALAAAEVDCDVLEHALSAQKNATATANNHFSS